MKIDNYLTKGFIVLCLCLVAISCGQEDDEAEEKKKFNQVTPVAGGGGVPSDTSGLAASSEEESKAVGSSLVSVAGQLALNLDGSSASLALEDSCTAGMFCLAQAFAQIADMVTGPAKCNFDLLLTDANGAAVTPNKLEGSEVYYVDGFGTVGLSDSGVTCATHAEVKAWVAKHGLDGEDVTGVEEEDSDEFYPPTRIVFTKDSAGDFNWKIIFFPKDKLEALLDIVTPNVEEDIDAIASDFSVFYGKHTEGATEETGKGLINMDWDALGLMVTTLTSLVGEEEGDDDGMPVGLITIDYDMTSDPSHLTFSFSDSFSFGDDGDSPFVPGTKAEVFQHSTGENYLLFTSSSFFGAAEDNNGDGDYDDDGDDSGMAVQVCLDSDDDIDMINSGDVAASDYLSTASKSYFQLIWQDSTVADAMPSKWHARAYMTQGGVYIAGPVSFDAGAGGTATTISPISIKVPRCSAVTAEQMTTWKGTMNTYFSKDAISLSGDSNEFAHLNLDLSATSDAARFLTTAEAEAAFPTFSYLKLVDDPTAASIDPVVAQ